MAETDEQTFADARAGDAAAFNALLGPILDPAFRVAVLVLGDPTEAEDAVQEAALRAWGKLRQLRGGRAVFRAWFLRIVVNECRMVRRRPWWAVLRVAAPHVSRDFFGEDAAVRRLDLREALAALSEPDRVALFLYYYLDLPIEEVARVLGVSVNGSKSRIHRALLRLRPDLEMEEVTP